MKLTIPLARRRNAGIQSRIAIGLKKIEIIRIIEENMSIMLRMSPVSINIPFRSSKPDVKSVNCIKG
jgi:hypothetical protein